MDIDQHRHPRRWELPFLAVPENVAKLRRSVCVPLKLWGLMDLADTVQLCLTELVANVITHVGAETPAWVAVSMEGASLRIEVRDPAADALPALRCLTSSREHGRGLRLVAAMADRWGVLPSEHGKTTWCELSVGVAELGGGVGSPPVTYLEALPALCGGSSVRQEAGSPLAPSVAEEASIGVIAHLLHWLRGRGADPRAVLDRAYVCFEARVDCC
ncbi:ATP-binding protein [Streptomyces sp. NPDC002536]